MSDATDHERLRQAALARIGRELSGKYRLDALLGVGGTAAVYVGFNIAVRRPCAVKVLHGQHRANAEIVERFKREAYAANRVRFEDRPHPNVVDILDAGESEGCLYLVEELLKGETLADFSWRQPAHRTPPALALEMLRPVVHAVGVAHAAGVVHRDIKPENIFLVDRSHLGRPAIPKILDFGIAQLVDSRITHKTSLHGTPTYMPPEAFTDPMSVDARADVWALGVVLYELVAGKNPFERPDGPWYAAAYAVQNDTPPSLAPLGVDAAVRAALWRCLSKDRAHRYGDAGALLSALEAASEPARTFEVSPRESVAAVRARMLTTGGHWNGLRVKAPWHSVGEVLAMATLPDLAHMRALLLSEAEGGGGAHNVAGDEVAQAVAQGLPIGQLAALEIADAGVGVHGAVALGNAPSLGTLASLGLPRNRLGDFGAIAIAQGPHFAWLESLDLSHNGVGDEGARSIAKQALLPGLAQLDLSGNRIGDRGARALAESPGLASLRALNLDGNPISPETVAWLRERGIL